MCVQVYLNKGYNTDGKAWSTPASLEGLEGVETDSSTTLYDAVVECRVIKTKKEIDIMQHITNLSSEAHFEVRTGGSETAARAAAAATENSSNNSKPPNSVNSNGTNLNNASSNNNNNSTDTQTHDQTQLCSETHSEARLDGT